jgi:hypothetical protein
MCGPKLRIASPTGADLFESHFSRALSQSSELSGVSTFTTGPGIEEPARSQEDRWKGVEDAVGSSGECPGVCARCASLD